MKISIPMFLFALLATGCLSAAPTGIKATGWTTTANAVDARAALGAAGTNNPTLNGVTLGTLPLNAGGQDMTNVNTIRANFYGVNGTGPTAQAQLSADGLGWHFVKTVNFGNVAFIISSTGEALFTGINATLYSIAPYMVLTPMTKAARNALPTPATGTIVFQSDNVPGLRVYNGVNWMRFTETID